VAAAALAALLWLPNPMQRVLDERTAAREAILEEVHTLETLPKEIATDPLLTEQKRQQMLQILDEALERLERNELSREEALAELTEAADRLRSLTDPSAEQRAIALSQAAETMKASPVAAALADALSEGDLQLAAAILEDLADELGQELTREQELELAEQLAGAAVRLANTNAELAEQFSQAAEGIRSGDLSGARQALAEAAQTTAETGQAAAASTVAQAGANRMGQAGQRVAQSGST
jgi:hypothetical protein